MPAAALRITARPRVCSRTGVQSLSAMFFSYENQILRQR
jgi:hypothetical protein